MFHIVIDIGGYQRLNLLWIICKLLELHPKGNTHVLEPRLLGNRTEAVRSNGMAITFKNEFHGVDQSTVEIEENRCN